MKHVNHWRTKIIMDIKALAFDTGGTVLDWHGGLVAALSRTGASHSVDRDWHAVTNDWRRRAMNAIVGQTQPAFNMDDVHRRTLDESLAHFDLQAFTPNERDRLWRAWHELDAWPDFPFAQATLRTALPVVSFTMLPTSLVVDVSRRNAIVWDAVISCEMIGVYKPHAEAYATAARWMALEPAQILMVACHNFDLNAAHKAGFRTAFVRRPKVNRRTDGRVTVRAQLQITIQRGAGLSIFQDHRLDREILQARG